MEQKENNELLMNGVIVNLENPGTKGLKDFLILAKSMSNIPQDKPEEFMEHLDDKAMDSAINLINLTLSKTFPEMTDEIDSWAMQNAMLILPKVIEMCSPKTTIEESKIDKIKERLNVKSSPE